MQRFAAALAFVAAIVLALPAAAETEPEERYASLVVDLAQDRVLHARNADALRFPASLTKMMTLYMVFDALEAGELGLDDKIVISRHAASQPPSKLYLRSGETITVEEAIYALVTKSANDVAAAVGERIGGSEWRFARMMTARARELGMTRTRFRNASGLPDDEQVTTARDMYLLSRALLENHPLYYGYFSTTEFDYRGRAYDNHNNLLGRVTGVDGIKTGYTRASGYNLASSVERDGQRLIAVVLGGSTSRVRDAHMEDLIERAFEAIDANDVNPTFMALNDHGGPASGFIDAAPRGPALAKAPPVEADEQELALASAELKRPAAQGSTERRGVKIVFADDAGAPTEAEAAPAEQPAQEPAVEKPAPVVVSMPEGEPEPEPAADPTAGPVRLADVRESEPRRMPAARGVFESDSGAIETAAAEPAAEPASERALSPVFQGGWSIQVGAFSTPSKAAARLEEVKSMSLAALGAADGGVEPTDGADPMYRARFTGLSQIAAARLCADLMARGDGCFPVSPKS